MRTVDKLSVAVAIEKLAVPVRARLYEVDGQCLITRLFSNPADGKLADLIFDWWMSGLILKRLSTIRKRLKDNEISLSMIAARFQLHPATVSKWFSHGTISARQLATLETTYTNELATLPEPSSLEATERAYIHAISLIRNEVRKIVDGSEFEEKTISVLSYVYLSHLSTDVFWKNFLVSPVSTHTQEDLDRLYRQVRTATPSAPDAKPKSTAWIMEQIDDWSIWFQLVTLIVTARISSSK